MTIGQLVFGIVAFILLVFGIISLNNQDEKSQTNNYTKLSFFVGIISLIVAIFDPLDTPKITNDGSGYDEEEAFGQTPTFIEDSEEKESSGDSPITEEPTYENEYEGSVIEDEESIGHSPITEEPTYENEYEGSVIEDEESIGHSPITEEPTYELEYEGSVQYYDSYSDFFGHERKDVFYMEYDGTPSSILIHMNGEFTKISFDFYAVAEMDPEEMAQLTFIADEDSTSTYGYAAIPKYNSSGSFNEDISGRSELKITFQSGGIPSMEHPCAVLIDNFSIE